MPPTSEALAEYAARRQRLMQAIGPDDVVILAGAREVLRNRDVHYRFRQHSDFWYLTGFTEPDAVAVLAPGRKDGAFVLFVRPRNAEREIWDGRRAGPEGACRDYGADQAHDIADFDAALPALLSGRARVHCALGEDPEFDARLTAAVRHLREVSRRGGSAPGEFVALENTLHEQRLIKSPAELTLLRHACKVSAQAHVQAIRYTAPGVNEYEVMAEVEHVFARAGMEPGYGSIVGGGDNACILHYVENDAPLRDGDLLLIDAGGEYRGYTADITRTFPVNGRFSPAQRALYELVLDAQLAAIAEMQPGKASSLPHQAAVRVLTEGLVRLGLLQGEPDALIKAEAYRRFYMHGTGHWLGMDVHDVGRYKLDGDSRPFLPGMVMTVEPGLYVAPDSDDVDPRWRGIGIRIEDDVLITDDGNEVLTADVPKTVDAIEALMARAAAAQAA